MLYVFVRDDIQRRATSPLLRCLDLWEATEHFQQHLGPASAQPMPRPASEHLCVIRACIAEQLVFQQGSSLYEHIMDGGGGSHDMGTRFWPDDFLARQLAGQLCWHAPYETQARSNPCAATTLVLLPELLPPGRPALIVLVANNRWCQEPA